MPLPVSLDTVAKELDGLMEEMTAFVNRKTGEVVVVSRDDLALVEDEEEGESQEDLPGWQVEMLPQLREIAEGVDWAALPDKFEVHEWQIMRDFADSVDDELGSSLLLEAVHGSGAFRMFRATLDDLELREEWYEFKHEALKEIAREALDELGIPFK